MTSNAMELGLQAARADNPKVAAGWFRHALAVSPRDTAALAWLGHSLCKLGETLEGTPKLRDAAARLLAKGDLAGALDVIAQLQQWGDLQGALSLLREATRVSPASARAQQMLAATCGQLNLTIEALAAGERALALDPDNAMMQVLQGSLEADSGAGTKARDRLQALLARQASGPAAFRAHKELARILDALGDYGSVFPHIEAAAAIAPELLDFRVHDPRLIPQMIEANYDGFDAELLQRWTPADFAREARAPVFVVGFYRSGTTLTQEILASQSGVFVADEADLMWGVKKALAALEGSSGDVPSDLRRLDLADARELRRTYWRLARARFGAKADSPVFVDKFTLNTIDIGLINCLFPDARVVFMLRDPRDVCLSCVSQLMAPSPATIHLLTWRGAAALYLQVMDLWLDIRDRLTASVLEVRYEDAVTDFDATYRHVFDFLGLAWNGSAADFHRQATGKYIASPSRNQVSRPLYASSVGRWKRHADRMREVDDLLGPLVDELGYAP